MIDVIVGTNVMYQRQFTPSGTVYDLNDWLQPLEAGGRPAIHIVQASKAVIFPPSSPSSSLENEF